MAVLVLEAKHILAMEGHSTNRYRHSTQHVFRAVLAHVHAMPPTQQKQQGTRTKQVTQMQQHNDSSMREQSSGHALPG